MQFTKRVCVVWSVLLSNLFSTGVADFNCICNYHVELAVYKQDAKQPPPFGYMYEFDCKPEAPNVKTSVGWVAVMFEHNLGFVESDSNVLVQICPGNIPAIDVLPVTSTVATQIQITTPTTSPTTVKTTTNTLTRLTTVTPTTTFTTESTTTTGVSATTTTTAKSTTTKSSTNPTTTIITPPPTTTTITTPTATSPTTTISTTTSAPKTRTQSTIPKTTAPTTTQTSTTSTTTTTPTTTFPKPTSQTTATTTKTVQTTTTPTTTPTTTTTTTATPTTTITTTITTPQTSDPTITAPATPTTSSIAPQMPTLTTISAFTTPIKAVPTVEYNTFHENLNLCPKTHHLMTHNSLLGFCYEFVVNASRTRDLAELHCKTFKGHLLSVTSLIEDKYIYKIIMQNGYTNKTFWTGLTISSNAWEDGSSTSYVQYIHRGPNVPGNCFVFQATTNDSILSTNDCNLLKPFICKYTVAVTTISTTTISTHTLLGSADKCPDAFRSSIQSGDLIAFAQQDSSCYTILDGSYNWQNAQYQCSLHNGHVLTMEGSDKTTFVNHFLLKYEIYQEVWTYSNYASVHVHPPYDHCGILKPQQDGTWLQTHCTMSVTSGVPNDVPRRVICEIDFPSAASQTENGKIFIG